MANITALVVEDERIAANAVTRQLSRDAEVTVVGVARDGRNAVSSIRTLKPDLIFLDIQIPTLNGFEVLEAIGVDQMPLVVFVTAYDRYLLRAFEVHALDYLLKPFSDERFGASLLRAKREVEFQRNLQRKHLKEFLESNSGPTALRRLPIKAEGKTVFVDLDQVDYIEASGNYVRVHARGKEYLTRDTLASFENRLVGSNFIRIHRSVIVNKDHVKELISWFTGEYIVMLTSGKELTLTRGYRNRLPLLKSPM